MVVAESGSVQQASGRGHKKAVSGELAIVPPLLGSSQRLLNKDHYEVYYQVVQLFIYDPEDTFMRCSPSCKACVVCHCCLLVRIVRVLPGT